MSNTNILHGLLQRINNIQEALEEVAVEVQNLLWAEEISDEVNAEERAEKRIDTDTLLPNKTVVTLSVEATECGIGSVGDTARTDTPFLSDKYIWIPEDSELKYRLVMLTGRDAGCVTLRSASQFTVNE